MNYTHLAQMQATSPSLDSPESARRRERLLRHESEAHELHKRRRRDRARRAWTLLSARRRRESPELPYRIDALHRQEPVR